MKSMAGCVSDRDTNVRNAAINGLVACYRDEGERVSEGRKRREGKEEMVTGMAISREDGSEGETNG